ncbi:hypothetical protein GQ53DRAFT_775709 [Thozetella sp. PMI_491]|nr:hypothetical protein GQ53DRAFT_775709 [Thozetella sp. PMI_491]
MGGGGFGKWTLLVSLTAFLLSLLVLAQIASRYYAGWKAAPHEVAAFIDAVDSSVAENESYDRDVSRVQRLEDKLRLGRLLRDIQKGGDDLREALNGLLLGEDDTRMRTAARILWANRRVELEERLRRLDLLRMRFLTVHMGIISATASDAAAKQSSPKDPEKVVRQPSTPTPPALPRSLTEGHKPKLPMRRLTTQAIGHQANVEGSHRLGWAGVIQELQRSPLMHKRHASIETSMENPS